MIFLSPVCSHEVHGIITPASLQPVPNPGLGVEVPGAKIPYISVPTCVPRMSVLYFLEKVLRSMLYVAVRQKTCASAVHPSRSSRCGQSVGTPTKLERCPHKMLLNSLLIIELPVISAAVNGASV